MALDKWGHLSHKGRKQRRMHVQNSKLIPTGEAFIYHYRVVTAAANPLESWLSGLVVY